MKTEMGHQLNDTLKMKVKYDNWNETETNTEMGHQLKETETNTEMGQQPNDNWKKLKRTLK